MMVQHPIMDNFCVQETADLKILRFVYCFFPKDFKFTQVDLHVYLLELPTLSTFDLKNLDILFGI